ncbi:mitochondrial CIV assembly protein Taco1 [Andalucia godoyi]|uniref:Mitochondrial CIV assembly protein Taco1 n=1 Tax=Andalucia godoyi TaxID=505711 RepID=A0A8K0F320_ANDGO|nr:mitochondrial CIV assembly protein Taco1 [Andalucia godoyi]|eukprot:ANDGO_03711.mRNA.1 mitochondrial CIV assembly protein Taco1
MLFRFLRPLGFRSTPPLCAGHSKWHNIRHQKAAADAKRSQIFTKLSTEITAAAREGGIDPIMNLRLGAAISRARNSNMPKDNIDKAVRKAAGDREGGVVFEQVMYEGHGPAGIAVMIEALTDNRNRTAPQVRHVFSKLGGAIGSQGSVAWMFDRKAVFTLEDVSKKIKDANTDQVLEASLDVGADFFEYYEEDDMIEVRGAPSDYARIAQTLEKISGAFMGELAYIPQTYMTIPEGEQRELVSKFLDALEDLDDVQHVFHNASQDS